MPEEYEIFVGKCRWDDGVYIPCIIIGDKHFWYFMDRNQELDHCDEYPDGEDDEKFLERAMKMPELDFIRKKLGVE